MAISTASQPVRVAFIGVGAVTAYHHLPGLRLDPRAELVADLRRRPRPAREAQGGMERRARRRPTPRLCAAPTEVDAVVIATPNDTHRPIAVAAARGRQARHVREAAGPERRRGPRDVRGGPRRRASCT